MLPSEWAQKKRMIAEGTSVHPGKWDNARTPYLPEIMDCISPRHWARRVTLKKSAQVAGSEGISNVLGWTIDVAPCATLVVHPTIESGRDWVEEKFEPTIQATRALRRKISSEIVRGRKGSTLKRKRFPGGSLVITGANSPAGLRQKSIRLLICDDFDEFPLSIGNQGDPAKMARARLISYQRTGQDKELDVSTPTNKATSRIDKQFEAGDQRYWHVPCPHCGLEQVLKWGGPDKPYGIKFNREPPHRAHYVCESGNGCVIEYWQLQQMNGRGRWVAAKPGPGREPSFHLCALNSPFTTWDHMVEAFLEAEGDPEELKTWINLWLGEAWDAGGNLPKAQVLLDRREEWPEGTCPAGVLLIVLAADVQADGVYYEFVGFGRDRQSWSLEHGFLAGETDAEGGKVWRDFDALRGRRFRDPLGNDRGMDGGGIDSNYLTDIVVAWCKTRPDMLPLRGEDGFSVPPFPGRATAREFSERGRRKRKGAKTFPVGTWQIKARYTGQLKLQGPGADGNYPPGYPHFSLDCDEDFFEQHLSEVFVRQKNRKTGKIQDGWHVVGTKGNHYLDCRVYAMAIAEKLGISRKTPAEWEYLERRYARQAERPQADLFAAPGATAPVAEPPPTAPPSTEPPRERRRITV